MIGTQIGRYKVLKLLGAGGMGEVYLAEHEELRRRVALKVLHANLAAQPALVARFLNEARAATAIQSPAFVTVFDWDRTPEGAPPVRLYWPRGGVPVLASGLRPGRGAVSGRRSGRVSRARAGSRAQGSWEAAEVARGPGRLRHL